MDTKHYPADIDARTTTEFFIIDKQGVRVSYSAKNIVNRVLSYNVLRGALGKVMDTIEANCGWNDTGLFEEDIQEIINKEY